MLQSIANLRDINSEEFSHNSFLSALGFNVKKEYQYAEEMTQMEKIEGEKTALGFYLSNHPIRLIQRENQSIPFNMFRQRSEERRVGKECRYRWGEEGYRGKKRGKVRE